MFYFYHFHQLAGEMLEPAPECPRILSVTSSPTETLVVSASADTSCDDLEGGKVPTY